MKTHTRREFVAIGLGVGFLCSKDADLLEEDHLRGTTATTIQAFRKVVSALRNASEPSALEMSVLDVRNFGGKLVALGISRIEPREAGDGACNHWLLSINAGLLT
jgi:hypothetical protein